MANAQPVYASNSYPFLKGRRGWGGQSSAIVENITAKYKVQVKKSLVFQEFFCQHFYPRTFFLLLNGVLLPLQFSKTKKSQSKNTELTQWLHR